MGVKVNLISLSHVEAMRSFLAESRVLEGSGLYFYNGVLLLLSLENIYKNYHMPGGTTKYKKMWEHLTIFRY